MKPLNRPALPLLAGALLLAACGCHSMSKTEQGAATGAAAGGLLGTIIGHQTDNKELGALIGAVTGATAGGLLGKQEELKDERDQAIARAHYEHRQRHAAARAVTNSDIVEMTQAGLPDQTIVKALNERGGKIDTSPKQLIYLQQVGVSTAVIQAMQSYDAATQRW